MSYGSIVPSDTVTFSQTQLINLTYNYAIALGDMNNDTHLDIVIGNSDELGTNQPDRIFINDGTGQFTDSGHLLGNSASFGASLGDFNLDGYLDIVFANGFPNGPLQADTVWFNEAAFTFTNESLGESYANAVAVGDLDMDGSLDLLLATYQGDQVWRNRINIVYDQVAFLPVVFQE